MTDPNFNFDKLIWPIESATFFSEHWEQRPLIISRKEANYYSSLLSKQDIDSIVHFTKPKFSEIRLLNNGQITSQNYENLDGSSNIKQLYDAYRQGNTISLNSLQKRWKSVLSFSRNLESFFNHPVNVNMYLSPQNSQGFTPHFDTHEAFIVQIEGSKHWRIYDSYLSLPLPMTDGSQQFVSRDKLCKPLYEVVLNAGDLLYIPRGYVHEALTAECSSLHLTVGIITLKWADLISNAIAPMSKQNVSFRKSLPVGFLNRSEVVASLKHQFKELLELLSNSASIEDAINQLAEQLLKQMSPLPDGHFTQIDELRCINLDSVVKKREGTICHITNQEDSVSILFPGNNVKGPIYIETALRFIAKSEAFSVKSISGNLTDNGKLVLVRRLIKEGLLTSVRETEILA